MNTVERPTITKRTRRNNAIFTCLGIFTLLALMLAIVEYRAVLQERKDFGLILMVEQGDSAGVQHQLAKGANPDARKHIKPHSIGEYVRRAIRQLLRRPYTDDRKPTVLILAASHPHPEIVRALLQAGAHTEYGDAEGRTALITAAYANQSNNLTELLNRGADVNTVDDKGRTSLMGAAVLGYSDEVDILLTHKADVNHKTVYGRTALMWAAGMHYPSIVEMLVKAPGIDLNCRDKEGKSALMYALGNGAPNVSMPMETRLTNPYTIITRSATGSISRQTNYRQVTRISDDAFRTLEILLKAGTDVHTKDDRGRTTLSVAETLKDPKLVEILKARAAH